MPPVRVVLVEDNEVFRDALELLLGMRDDVEVVASVGDGIAAVAAAKEHRPDVVLMDYRMPALDGIQATAQIVAASARRRRRRADRVRGRRRARGARSQRERSRAS